jgi:hypothetical protein
MSRMSEKDMELCKEFEAFVEADTKEREALATGSLSIYPADEECDCEQCTVGWGKERNAGKEQS